MGTTVMWLESPRSLQLIAATIHTVLCPGSREEGVCLLLWGMFTVFVSVAPTTQDSCFMKAYQFCA